MATLCVENEVMHKFSLFHYLAPNSASDNMMLSLVWKKRCCHESRLALRENDPFACEPIPLMLTSNLDSLLPSVGKEITALCGECSTGFFFFFFFCPPKTKHTPSLGATKIPPKWKLIVPTGMGPSVCRHKFRASAYFIFTFQDTFLDDPAAMTRRNRQQQTDCKTSWFHFVEFRFGHLACNKDKNKIEPVQFLTDTPMHVLVCAYFFKMRKDTGLCSDDLVQASKEERRGAILTAVLGVRQKDLTFYSPLK